MSQNNLRNLENSHNYQLQVEYPELPEAIMKVVEETIANNPKCLDPDQARGRCLQISHDLIFNLALIGKTPFTECKLIFRPKPNPHFWIFVDGWHIDLTARQFSPFEQCPKIWKHDDSEAHGLFCVVRGKGMVLFKLVPFDKKPGLAYNVKEFLRSLRAKKRKLTTSILLILNQKFGGLLKRTYSFINYH